MGGVHWTHVGRIRVTDPATEYAEKYTVHPTDLRQLLHRGWKTRLVAFLGEEWKGERSGEGMKL